LHKLAAVVGLADVALRPFPGIPGVRSKGTAYAAGVGILPLPLRVARAVGKGPVSERITHAQEVAYGAVIGWARRSPLHTDALGHSEHPLLTDLTLGVLDECVHPRPDRWDSAAAAGRHLP